jgi:hypothetical protein
MKIGSKAGDVTPAARTQWTAAQGGPARPRSVVIVSSGP